MSSRDHAIYNDGLWWVWDRTTFTYRLIDSDGEEAFAVSGELVASVEWKFARDYLNRRYPRLHVPKSLEGVR